MGTIGLAHRTHRDFVVDWLEPEESPTELDEALAERVEIARALARAGGPEEPARTPRDPWTDDETREPEIWLAGEPTF
jgi:hypothetical protein